MATIEQLIKQAEQTNDKELYVQIGNSYMYGKNVSKDMAQAVTYYLKAANLGSLDGKTKLGVAYYKGEGVTKDYKTAKKYLQEAANQGSATALFYLGDMCYEGNYGLLAGKGKAFEFWMQAAKKGQPSAQYNIAISYMTDEWGAEKNLEKAAFWFMCAYQNRKSSKSTIDASKKCLDSLAKYVNLNSVKERVVQNYPEYLNL